MEDLNGKIKKNPWKQYAVRLAHQMGDELRIQTEFLSPRQEEEIREHGKWLRDEIVKVGLASDIELILYYAEQYKELKFGEYQKWIYE